MKISGIYKIINKINGKYYIGSSLDISGVNGRWVKHINDLNHNRHQNNHLQKSWNKYGKEAFDFLILESNIPQENLLLMEQKYLDESLKEKENCYNISFIAGRIEMNDEVKRKISKSLTGIKRPYKPCNPDVVRKRVESRKWYKHSEKTKGKISKSNIGKIKSKSAIEKMSQKLKGKKPWNIHNTIYTFVNNITKETFIGIKSDFIKKYNLLKQPVYLMINGNGRLKSYKGWKVIHSIQPT